MVKFVYNVHLSQRFPGVSGEIKRREVELDPQVSPEGIMSREVELGCESWTSFLLQVHCYSMNSGATDIVLVTLPSTAVA